MKSIVYVGPYDEVEIEVAPRRWRAVKKGEPVKLPAKAADSFLRQVDNWQPLSTVDTEPTTEPALPEPEED